MKNTIIKYLFLLGVITVLSCSTEHKRDWNREVLCCDVDSSVIVNWKNYSSREKVMAIYQYFDIDLDTNNYSWEECERMLFDNAFIEWEY